MASMERLPAQVGCCRAERVIVKAFSHVNQNTRLETQSPRAYTAGELLSLVLLNVSKLMKPLNLTLFLTLTSAKLRLTLNLLLTLFPVKQIKIHEPRSAQGRWGKKMRESVFSGENPGWLPFRRGATDMSSNSLSMEGMQLFDA